MSWWFFCCCSLSHVQLFATPWTAGHQACCSLSPRVCSDSCLLSWWHHPTISSSVAHFSSFPQSFPASGYYPMSGQFAEGGPSIGTSASASVLPMSVQGWFISFRIDWFDLLAVQGTLKSLLQHHSSKASIVRSSAFFMVQLSHPYVTIFCVSLLKTKINPHEFLAV